MRKVATLQQAVVVLVAERFLDALTLAAVGLIALPLFFNATGRRAVLDGLSAPGSGTLAIVGVGVAIAAVAFVIAWRVRWRALRTLIAHRLASLRADALSVVRQTPRGLAVLGAATVVAWVMTFLLHYAVLEALDPPSSLVHPVLLAVVVTLSTNLSMLAPATPGGIGIFHAAAAAPLLVAGMSSEVAVAYALLVHVMNTVPPMLVGAACLGGPVVLERVRAVAR